LSRLLGLEGLLGIASKFLTILRRANHQLDWFSALVVHHSFRPVLRSKESVYAGTPANGTGKLCAGSVRLDPKKKGTKLSHSSAFENSHDKKRQEMPTPRYIDRIKRYV